MKTKSYSALCLVSAAMGLLAVGCGDTSEPVVSEQIKLTKAQSCADLETMLKQDALLKMNAQIDAQIESSKNYDMYGGPVYEEGGVVGVGVSGATGGGEGNPTGEPAQGDDSGNGAPPNHSDTNTQVEGVDEADIVKTDGNFIYLLHGQSFKVVTAWPASDLAVSGTFDVEGQPLEMFVSGDKVVIYSSVDGGPILEAAGLEPKGSYYDGYYGGGVTDGAEPYYGGYYYPLTKVTVLTLDGTQASVAKELYFEGSYNSSRRVDSRVRTILSGGAHGLPLKYWPENLTEYPETAAEWEAEFEKLRAENALLITNAGLNDFLPYRLVKNGDAIESLPASCGDYYMPTEGSTAYGLTQIESINLDDLAAAPTETAVIGQANTVYANGESLYLAAEGYVEPTFFGFLPQTPISYIRTHLHKFDLTADPTTPTYVGSGSVPGHVKNQFSLDEKDGNLRVATTDQLASAESWETRNGLYVLTEGLGELTTIGSIENLAPNEQIYSARFVGNRGYIVTFRQVDPLFVIDLADPTTPTLKAELKIPGFSEYMHPMDDGHLLTIGQDATDQGQVTGLALQIFDVRIDAAPVLKHKYVFGGEQYGYSEASYNHKAFTYYKELDALAFPFVSWDNTDGTMKSTLELFRVTVEDGLQPIGSIDHTSFFEGGNENGYCGGYFGVEVRRGLFIDNFVYSISHGGVIASSMDAPETAVAKLPLPAPESNWNDCGVGGGVDDGF
jgi:hypothetical protein